MPWVPTRAGPGPARQVWELVCLSCRQFFTPISFPGLEFDYILMYPCHLFFCLVVT